MGVRWYGQLKHAISKKTISQACSLYAVVVSSIETMLIPLFHPPPLSFPTVFADFLATFLQEHESILRNVLVYRDVTIYRNN